MKENRMNLTGLIVRSISPYVQLNNKKYKRELYLDYGRHSYIVGEIVDFPTEFSKIEKGTVMEAVIWVNSIIKSGCTFTNLLITSIKINQNENENNQNHLPSADHADVSTCLSPR